MYKDNSIGNKDFCGLCGGLLSPDEDVTCTACDKAVMGVMAHGAKMSRPKKVRALSPDGTVRKYRSMSDASKKTKIGISTISRACSNSVAAGGMVWGYA